LPGGVRRELGARAAESAAPALRDQVGFERVSEPVEPLDDPLSEREREVLALLASGKTNREVAAELYVAEGTVKAHVASIYRKLDVHNRAEMLNKARALGLLGPSP
jgi:DNA-binding NarL/FixJ family response regulator